MAWRREGGREKRRGILGGKEKRLAIPLHQRGLSEPKSDTKED